jgi:heme-degrading monooxygenase HmoA
MLLWPVEELMVLVVIFEAQPRQERRGDYFQLAGRLKPKLEAIEGFVKNERFASRRTEGRILSLSIWRDKEALGRWRSQAEHRAAQERGRAEIFQDYRLRVGEVTEDGKALPSPGATGPENSEREIGRTRFATVSELFVGTGRISREFDALMDSLERESGANAPIDHEIFESIHCPVRRVILATWRRVEPALAWTGSAPQLENLRHLSIRIIRDYGMFDRGEAPRCFL